MWLLGFNWRLQQSSEKHKQKEKQKADKQPAKKV
jgi:hypothetical protein